MNRPPSYQAAYGSHQFEIFVVFKRRSGQYININYRYRAYMRARIVHDVLKRHPIAWCLTKHIIKYAESVTFLLQGTKYFCREFVGDHGHSEGTTSQRSPRPCMRSLRLKPHALVFTARVCPRASCWPMKASDVRPPYHTVHFRRIKIYRTYTEV